MIPVISLLLDISSHVFNPKDFLAGVLVGIAVVFILIGLFEKPESWLINPLLSPETFIVL